MNVPPGFYIKKSAEKFDIRKSDGNIVMTKTRALKSLPTINFYGKTPNVKKSDNKLEWRLLVNSRLNSR